MRQSTAMDMSKPLKSPMSLKLSQQELEEENKMVFSKASDIVSMTVIEDDVS